MADYGHDLSFGIFVTPQADAGPHILELARRADAAGLDWVSVQDHPYQPAFLDAWTLLTAIAAATQTIGVFPNVANLPLRPPAMLAPPAAVRRIYNIAGSFGGSSSAFLQGPTTVWAEQLAGLALDEGISGFVLMADDVATVQRFAAEVAPSVRELVAGERGPRSTS